ncbi:hypothetical protein M441DRAFT_146048 [Trichoderma asperellum CBS 433.97]|uniref:Putative gamma-glutamylcyclotransferase n=2 Tax=Trichoderma asperellum TaxID=101201 RepID=A0A2T3Z1D6_TRIA4|nr:hypothetical protein M441DRAFT_146048 [Trichoderma asperellum CBS 433.97]PTB38616.1 hypothetical protein M441DRAFT_146048 [Trichoderma asperellum CBS 433.97]
MVEKRSRASKTLLVAKNGEAKYLVKLEHDSPLSTDSAELIRCLPKKPRILTGLDDDGKTTQFCLLSDSQKAEFLDALFKARPFYEPTLIRASVASKDPSSTTLYPTLGVDTTLPQFRLDKNKSENNISSNFFSSARPAQDEYPVWYFFYGTLADAGILSRIIGSSEEQNSITYKRASVQRGRLCTLNEKYWALVDAEQQSKVDGWAYLVKNQHEEDSLRVYETGIYEVVRCTMELMDEKQIFIQGLTFRLA